MAEEGGAGTRSPGGRGWADSLGQSPGESKLGNLSGPPRFQEQGASTERVRKGSQSLPQPSTSSSM